MPLVRHNLSATTQEKRHSAEGALPAFEEVQAFCDLSRLDNRLSNDSNVYRVKTKKGRRVFRRVYHLLVRTDMYEVETARYFNSVRIVQKEIFEKHSTNKEFALSKQEAAYLFRTYRRRLRNIITNQRLLTRNLLKLFKTELAGRPLLPTVLQPLESILAEEKYCYSDTVQKNALDHYGEKVISYATTIMTLDTTRKKVAKILDKRFEGFGLPRIRPKQMWTV